MSSLHMLAIKTKTFRDLIDESPFKKSDVVTIQVSLVTFFMPLILCQFNRSALFFCSLQDPENLGARDLSSFDYVKSDKRVNGKFDRTTPRCLTGGLFLRFPAAIQTRIVRTTPYRVSTLMQQEVLGKCFV